MIILQILFAISALVFFLCLAPILSIAFIPLAIVCLLLSCRIGRKVALPLVAFALLALSTPLFAQDVAPGSVPAAAAQVGWLAWILANLQQIMPVVVAVVFLARLIVKLTPTPKDDSVLASIIIFLSHVGLKMPTQLTAPGEDSKS